MVYIVLGKGFEEAEAIIPCDLLRRAGVDVRFAGIGGLDIEGGHGITVRADCLTEEIELENLEMIVLPGGLGGVASIRSSETAMDAVAAAYEKGCYVAAICAAPVILAELGILEEKNATCYPGMEAEMTGAFMNSRPAVADGKVITGMAAGTAFDFALKLIEVLRGKQAADAIAAGIVYQQGG